MGQSDPKIAGSNPPYLASSGATFHTKSTPTHHTTTKTLIPQVNQVKKRSPRVLPTRAKGSHTQSTRAIPGNKRAGHNPSCPHQYSEPASSILSKSVTHSPATPPVTPTPQTDAPGRVTKPHEGFRVGATRLHELHCPMYHPRPTPPRPPHLPPPPPEDINLAPPQLPHPRRPTPWASSPRSTHVPPLPLSQVTRPKVPPLGNSLGHL